MDIINTKKKYEAGFKIGDALKCFGGFVRYYDTTEALSELADIVSVGSCKDVLACCAGGDQALTILGAVKSDVHSLYAVDINAAQLFVLAGKIDFLNRHHVFPSFKQIQQAYPDRIRPVRKDVRRLESMYFQHKITQKLITPPSALAKKYSIIVEDEMFVLPKSGPFWKEDEVFIKKICERANNLRLAQMDIFDNADYFSPKSLDLIYLSDIYWQEELEYFILKLAKLVILLRPGGRIITHLDPGDDFMGQGISPGSILLKEADKFMLKIAKHQDGGYLVLERTKGK